MSAYFYFILHHPHPHQRWSQNTPTRLNVPKLNLDLAVTPASINADTWEVATTSANFLINSAPLGAGHTIIYGHNLDNLLGRITHLRPEDRLILSNQAGEQFEYRVSETMTLDKADVGQLMATKGNILTIYTCSGWFDEKRFVVRALPI